MKHKITMIVLILTAAIVLSLYAVPRITGKKQDEKETLHRELVATHLYDMLGKMFSAPISISHGIASDTLLKELLKGEDAIPSQEIESDIKEYLSALESSFFFVSPFIVSEKSHRYYTPSGIYKIVNPGVDPYDIWYQIFLDSGKDYSLNIDLDQVNDYRLTVFVNVRIQDDDGSLLGVCGVGLLMDGLQDLLASFEADYGFKMSLINEKGLVQLDADSSNIENTYISDAIADKAGSSSFTTVKKTFGGVRMTRYMENLGWYLVLQGHPRRELGVDDWLFPVLLYLILGLLLLLLIWESRAALAYGHRQDKLLEDPLTGLPNRNYMNESFGEQGVFNTTRYKSLAMFDIDRFKAVNETRDGNEIIIRLVKLTKTAMGDAGIMFRCGGDEFVFFLEMPAGEAEESFKSLCVSIRETLGVTISVGIVEIDLFESIKTNYHRAVLHCYMVKAAGGDGVSRKR